MVSTSIPLVAPILDGRSGNLKMDLPDAYFASVDASEGVRGVCRCLKLTMTGYAVRSAARRRFCPYMDRRFRSVFAAASYL